MITRKELIKKYIEFFKSKNHKEIPNASLIPENDPTVLFTTAGMHPLVPYLLGQPHPLGKRLMNVQRCIRTIDIEEVGDSTHHTFFEMIGNWSLGDYWKKEAIQWSFEFATKILNLPIGNLAVTVFGGDNREPQVPKDEESAKILEELGIPKKRIAYLPGGIHESEDNWWGPAGKTGPCGPSTEMFYWKDNSRPAPEKFGPEDETWVEIWNDVLMQYNKDEKGNYNLAKQKNIDNGRGLERVLAIINGLEDNYLTEVWTPIIEKIEELSNKKYSENPKEMRIIADHIKASCFIIADGIVPANSDQGYVLRRLIRRAVRNGKTLGIEKFTKKIAEPVFEIYNDYPELEKNKEKILNELEKEEEKFLTTLEKGLNKFNKFTKDKKELSGKEIFLLYQSYGFPIELTEEIAKEKNIKINKKDFEKELKKHQELSRTASAGKFKSGLADNSEATTKLHTAAHLLLKALQIILKDNNILQRGSNITPERLRLDFNFERKLTEEEVKKVEDLVNEKINEKIKVVREEMTPSEAKEKGAQGMFDRKYPDIVSVYTIGNFSKEICTGPHVKNTSELGKFKIKKQQSSSAGVRRIKAVLG
ncbi:MAG: alanine--tRNA ligase [Candidatus Pacearchaeota archaeon]|jgi:alanyl-tRNA synthetase